MQYVLVVFVIVVVFIASTDRASTIPSNARACQSGTWSAGQENIRGTSTIKLQREHENRNNKNDETKGTITQSTCHKNIGHSIVRVWYRASREPSSTLPGLQPCTQTHSIYNSVLSGFQVSLSAQSMSLRESLGWSNQRGSKTSQACYSHLESPHLPVFGRVLLFLHPHAAINLQPLLRSVLYQTPGSTGGIESIVRTN